MAIFVLTGCASGIGAHLAGALSRRSAHDAVVATDIHLESLEKRKKADHWGDNVRLLALDVRKTLDWEAALSFAEKELGGLDVVMNIAGVLSPSWVEDITPEAIDLHLDVNVKGTMLGTQAAAKRMIARGRGHIINIGSLASLVPVPGLSLYAASKFAVRGFSLAAATELSRHGIALTLVMPDAVQTPMLDQQVDYEQAALTFSGSRPLSVEDIERAIMDEVLPKRPLELALPLGRGLLARVSNTAPRLAQTLAPILSKKGREKQERIKQGRR